MMSNDRPCVFAGEARYDRERGHWEVELLDETGQSIGYRAVGATRAEAEDRALWLVACRRSEVAEAARARTFMQRLVAEHPGTLIGPRQER
jgi:hypothetical protein